MTRNKKDPATEQMRQISVTIVDLEQMSVGELQVVWQRLFGESARSRNRRYLIKRATWRINELREGGLSARAKKKIEELAATAPIRRRLSPTQAQAERELIPLPPPRRVRAQPKKPSRDPRLPPAGTVLRKLHHGAEHTVRVGEDSFEYEGRAYRSLSAIAKQIAGTEWNGFSFFGLTKGTKA